MRDDLLTVIQGDAPVRMRELPDESVQCCVTDPPYHLTTGKKGGSGAASENLNSPAGRARVTTGFMGMKWDGGDIAFRPEIWREVLRVLKPGAYLLAFGGTRTYHRMVCAIEDAGFEIRDQIGWLYGSGFPKSLNLEGDWDGWGTALKPAWEPIVMARKPLVGTVAANVQKFGTGAINVNACRVACDPAVDARDIGRVINRNVRRPDGWGMNDKQADRPSVVKPEGRWPANVIHDGSEEVLAEFAKYGDSKGASAPVTRRGADKFRNSYGEFPGQEEVGITFQGDTGTAARFFYCAKASRADREDGMNADRRAQDESRKPRKPGGDNPRNRGVQQRGNFHPTVKPTALMRWLITLVCPVGGTVLDPFAGSGTTGRAALELGRKAILIELNPDYITLIKQRTNVTLGLPLCEALPVSSASSSHGISVEREAQSPLTN